MTMTVDQLKALPARRYVVGTGTSGNPMLWCDGTFYRTDRRGGANDSAYETIEKALANGQYSHEVQEPEARAWAEKHGHSAALFPGEDEAPAEDWPKWYIHDSGVNQEIHRRDKTEHTFLCYGRRWALAKWYAGNKWERFWSEYGEDAHEVTEPQARAYAAEHSIPWPGEWGEGVTPVPPVPPVPPTRPSGELPEVEQPAPEPQPVGYSCRDCGAMLGRDEYGESSAIPDWHCDDCGLLWDDGDPMPAWVQPGPRPGPWEDRVDDKGRPFKWTGEVRRVLEGEHWVPLSGCGTGAPAAGDGPDGVCILRSKDKPAEAGAQCRGCSEAGYVNCMHGDMPLDHFATATANPTAARDLPYVERILPTKTPYGKAITMQKRTLSINIPLWIFAPFGWAFKGTRWTTLTIYKTYRAVGDGVPRHAKRVAVWGIIAAVAWSIGDGWGWLFDVVRFAAESILYHCFS